MLVNIQVEFRFPATYPDVPPYMEIASSDGPLTPENLEDIKLFLDEQV